MNILEQARQNSSQGNQKPRNILQEARERTQVKEATNPTWQKAKDFGLGLLQFGVDTATGLPEQFKRASQFGVTGPGSQAFGNLAEKAQQALPDRPNLEQYAEDPEGFSSFNVGRYGPDVALLGGGAINQAAKLTNKAVGKSIIKDANEIGSALQKQYDKFFGRTEEALAAKLRADPPIVKKQYTMDPHSDIPLNVKETIVKPGEKILNKENLSDFKAGSDYDINRPIDKFINEPTIENAHWAKSSVNQLERELRRLKASRGLTPTETASRHAASKLKKQLTQFMEKEFDQLDPKFKHEYQVLTKKYAKEYGPYLANSSIRKARLKPTQEGYIEPWRLPSKLAQQGGDPFHRALGTNYPALHINRMLAGPIGKGALGTTVAAALAKKILGEH